MDGEADGREAARDPPGAGFLYESRIICLGVVLSGEVKRFNREAIGKPSAPQETRGPGAKVPQSLITYLKSDDLGLARAKRGETPVEARNSSDVQFLKMSWVKAQKTNLVRGSLVPPEAARKQASG